MTTEAEVEGRRGGLFVIGKLVPARIFLFVIVKTMSLLSSLALVGVAEEDMGAGALEFDPETRGFLTTIVLEKLILPGIFCLGWPR